MNYLTIIVFICIIAVLFFLGEMFIRLQEKKEALDTIIVYKHNTKYSDKDKRKTIKKINALYKHGYG